MLALPLETGSATINHFGTRHRSHKNCYLRTDRYRTDGWICATGSAITGGASLDVSFTFGGPVMQIRIFKVPIAEPPINNGSESIPAGLSSPFIFNV
jgi:hypothetical protein